MIYIDKNKCFRERKFFNTYKVMICITSLLLVILIILGTTLYVNAKFRDEHGTNVKYYRSVQLKSGDTLWNLAQEYKGNYYTSTTEYIQEILQINQLSNDAIQEGKYIMMPYYLDER